MNLCAWSWRHNNARTHGATHTPHTESVENRMPYVKARKKAENKQKAHGNSWKWSDYEVLIKIYYSYSSVDKSRARTTLANEYLSYNFFRHSFWLFFSSIRFSEHQKQHEVFKIFLFISPRLWSGISGGGENQLFRNTRGKKLKLIKDQIEMRTINTKWVNCCGCQIRFNLVYANHPQIPRNTIYSIGDETSQKEGIHAKLTFFCIIFNLLIICDSMRKWIKNILNQFSFRLI